MDIAVAATVTEWVPILDLSPYVNYATLLAMCYVTSLQFTLEFSEQESVENEEASCRHKQTRELLLVKRCLHVFVEKPEATAPSKILEVTHRFLFFY